MKRSNLWKWVLVIFVVAWAVYTIYPPQGRNVLDVFEEKARSLDETYTNIVTTARDLEKKFPDRTFGNLKSAVGDRDISKYFPEYDVSKEKNRSRAILNNLQRESSGKIKLGLDLQGGTSFLVGLDTAQIDTKITNKFEATEEKERVLTEAIEVLRKRVDRFGVAEPILQPAGNDRILIQLPGLSEAEKQEAESTIKQAAFLEFRLVHPESDEMVINGQSEPGYTNLAYPHPSRTGQQMIPSLLVKKAAEGGLTGKNVKMAMTIRDPVSGQPKIIFELDGPGASIFSDVTRDNVGRQLAIVLDGVVYSAPNINGPIPGGRGEIAGGFELKEAITLANVLENPLETPVKILQSSEVDPSLGKDAIRSGINSALYGTIAVAGFMLIYYLIAGVVANIALLLNIIILLAVMVSVGTTLTLPGIAGIVLTIGMAVDANVLIFERIREELAAGKSLRGAVSAGYDKAFGTIFDSNLTTLIASVILIYLGTGPVKGFGVALTIGIAVSMFTALVVTRLFFDWMLDKNLIRSLRMLHVVQGSKINFMRWSVPAFVASWLLIAIGIGWGIKRGEEVLGIDFKGGDAVTLTFNKRVDVERLRETVAKLDVGDPQIQYQKVIAEDKETLTIVTRFDSGNRVVEQLKQSHPDAGFNAVGLEKVGPTIGKEIARSAVISGLLAMFGILIYVAFRYEFSFAVGAIVAIVHDVLMTMGWFFMTDRQMNAPVVAAILTIIGFSINDTIVIFDRIREDLKLEVRGTFTELVNVALNQTFSRTIITSGTVLLATLSLYIFGGGVINDFAFTFLVGIITGCYSSIYIASALVIWWHKGQRPATASMGGGMVMDNTVEARV